MEQALVVDDSRAMRKILQELLANFGFDVIEANDGRAGIEVLAENHGPFRLALVDWNMPEMNGLQFVRLVRADERHQSMKIMMVTTENDINHVCQALEAGANEYLMKPFTRSMVEDKLRIMGVLE